MPPGNRRLPPWRVAIYLLIGFIVGSWMGKIAYLLWCKFMSDVRHGR